MKTEEVISDLAIPLTTEPGVLLNTAVTIDKLYPAKRLSEEISEEELAKLSPKKWIIDKHPRAPTIFLQIEEEAMSLNKELRIGQNKIQEIMEPK